jgi:hypothetical protein
MNPARRPAFWRDLAYDPEELGAGARQTEKRKHLFKTNKEEFS